MNHVVSNNQEVTIDPDEIKKTYMNMRRIRAQTLKSLRSAPKKTVAPVFDDTDDDHNEEDTQNGLPVGDPQIIQEYNLLMLDRSAVSDLDLYNACLKLSPYANKQRARSHEHIRAVAEAVANSRKRLPVLTEASTAEQNMKFCGDDIASIVLNGDSRVWMFAGGVDSDTKPVLFGNDRISGMIHQALISIFETIESSDSRQKRSNAEDLPSLYRSEYVVSLSFNIFSGSGVCGELSDESDSITVKLALGEDAAAMSFLLHNVTDALRIAEKIRQLYENQNGRLVNQIFKNGNRYTDSLCSSQLVISISVDRRLLILSCLDESRDNQTRSLACNQAKYSTHRCTRGQLIIIDLPTCDCLCLNEGRSIAPNVYTTVELAYELGLNDPFNGDTTQLMLHLEASALLRYVNDLLSLPYTAHRILSKEFKWRSLYVINITYSPLDLVTGFMRILKDTIAISHNHNVALSPAVSSPRSTFFDPFVLREAMYGHSTPSDKLLFEMTSEQIKVSHSFILPESRPVRCTAYAWLRAKLQFAHQTKAFQAGTGIATTRDEATAHLAAFATDPGALGGRNVSDLRKMAEAIVDSRKARRLAIRKAVEGAAREIYAGGDAESPECVISLNRFPQIQFERSAHDISSLTKEYELEHRFDGKTLSEVKEILKNERHSKQVQELLQQAAREIAIEETSRSQKERLLTSRSQRTPSEPSTIPTSEQGKTQQSKRANDTAVRDDSSDSLIESIKTIAEEIRHEKMSQGKSRTGREQAKYSHTLTPPTPPAEPLPQADNNFSPIVLKVPDLVDVAPTSSEFGQLISQTAPATVAFDNDYDS